LWSVRLKDGREVTLRFLTLEDKEKLVEMFASMSDEALKWGMPPYTQEVIERWMSNLKNLIPLVAECNNRMVGYASIFKYAHPRRKGVCDLGMYLHQDFHNVGLGTAMLGYLLELAKKEGVLKDSYFGADGKYHDELVMGITWPHDLS